MPEIVTEPTETPTETPAAGATKETATETPAKTLVETPVAIMKPDGTFIDGWQQHDLVPEEFRKEECLKPVKSFPNAIKQIVNQSRMIGKNKIAIPTDKSKPEEWDAYWEAGGRPKTPDDYQVEIPPDLADLYSKERLQATKELAHKLGVNQKQFAEYMAFEMGQAVQLLDEQEKADAQARKDAETKLRTDFGAAYDERMHVAKRLIAEAIPREEERMEFLQKYGNDPLFIRFASTIGARMAESKALIAQITTNTPGEAMAQIKKLEATPGYMALSSTMSQEEREGITKQIRELYKEAYPAPARPAASSAI